MKTFVAATIVAIAGLASAQLDNIPTCALTCFVGPLTSDGCPSLEDFACHCKKADTLLSAVQPCVLSSCSAEDQALVISGVEKTCAEAGVPIDVPEPSTAAPEPTSAAPESSSAAPEPTSAAPEPSTEAPEPTEAPATTDLAPTSAPSSGYPVPTGNGTIPTASPSTSLFTGGAPQATQAVGILGAAALALLAL